MTTSMNDNQFGNSENDNLPPSSTNGALADGLTIIRAVLTPLIMFVIVKAWSGQSGDPMGFVSLNLSLVLLASILFLVAALTDILDDLIGGSEENSSRLLGWFDNIADDILIGGTLIALLWVTYKAGFMHWSFAVPAAVLIIGGLVARLLKRSADNTRLGDFAGAAAMFAACTLVASPWLSNFFDGIRANGSAEKIMEVYNNASPWAWNIGIAALWLAAILSILSWLKPSSQMDTINDNTA